MERVWILETLSVCVPGGESVTRGLVSICDNNDDTIIRDKGTGHCVSQLEQLTSHPPPAGDLDIFSVFYYITYYYPRSSYE